MVVSSIQRRRRNSRPLITAVTMLIIIGVAATGWVTIREFQVQRSVYAKILQQKLDTTRTQFRVFLTPFGNHLTTMQHWQAEGLLDPGDPVRNDRQTFQRRVCRINRPGILLGNRTSSCPSNQP